MIRFRIHGMDSIGFVTRTTDTVDETDKIIEMMESVEDGEVHQIEVIRTIGIDARDWKNGNRTELF